MITIRKWRISAGIYALKVQIESFWKIIKLRDPDGAFKERPEERERIQNLIGEIEEKINELFMTLLQKT